MRHRKKGKTLGKKRGPRKALFRGLATSLLLYEKMKTTSAKAKAIRPIVERLISISKTNSVTTRRRLAAYLLHANAVKKAVEVIGPRYKDRQGGYTRIVKLGQRLGDAAHEVRIELV